MWPGYGAARRRCQTISGNGHGLSMGNISANAAARSLARQARPRATGHVLCRAYHGASRRAAVTCQAGRGRATVRDRERGTADAISVRSAWAPGPRASAMQSRRTWRSARESRQRQGQRSVLLRALCPAKVWPSRSGFSARSRAQGSLVSIPGLRDGTGVARTAGSWCLSEGSAPRIREPLEPAPRCRRGFPCR
jgi:hypothetical protein